MLPILPFQAATSAYGAMDEPLQPRQTANPNATPLSQGPTMGDYLKLQAQLQGGQEPRGELGRLFREIAGAQQETMQGMAESGLVRRHGIHDAERTRPSLTLDDISVKPAPQTPTERYQRMWGNQQRGIQNAQEAAQRTIANFPNAAVDRMKEDLSGTFIDAQGRRVVTDENYNPVGFSGTTVQNEISPTTQLPTGSGIPMSAAGAFIGQGSIPEVDRSSAFDLDARDARGAAIQQIGERLMRNAVPEADLLDGRPAFANQGQSQPAQSQPTPSAFPGGGTEGEIPQDQLEYGVGPFLRGMTEAASSIFTPKKPESLGSVGPNPTETPPGYDARIAAANQFIPELRQITSQPAEIAGLPEAPAPLPDTSTGAFGLPHPLSAEPLEQLRAREVQLGLAQDAATDQQVEAMGLVPEFSAVSGPEGATPEQLADFQRFLAIQQMLQQTGRKPNLIELLSPQERQNLTGMPGLGITQTH